MIILHSRTNRGSVRNVIREIDQKLSETTFRGRIIAQDRRKGGIAKRLGEALTESLASPVVIAETGSNRSADGNAWRRKAAANGTPRIDPEVTHRRKQRTTCLSSLTVCCSTSCVTMLLRTVPTA
jgi:hypothetical protein